MGSNRENMGGDRQEGCGAGPAENSSKIGDGDALIVGFASKTIIVNGIEGFGVPQVSKRERERERERERATELQGPLLDTPTQRERHEAAASPMTTLCFIKHPSSRSTDSRETKPLQAEQTTLQW
ncbi:hypothetical protein L7F22_060197 [Adiantum nelumboides]|nr:hypothetical protein [Adiantum nelumboides]